MIIMACRRKKRRGTSHKYETCWFSSFLKHQCAVLQGGIHLSAGCLGISKPCLQQVLSSERPACLRDAWRNSPGLRCCSWMRLSDEKGARAFSQEKKKMIAKGRNAPRHGSQCCAFPWRVTAMFRSRQLFSLTPCHAKNYLSRGYALTRFSSSFRKGNPVV